jgi:SAM-dependent methyltransferase
MAEAFKPIPVRPPEQAPLQFVARLALDFQFLTCWRFLKRELAPLKGQLLDVGAGESPWRRLAPNCKYMGVDVQDAAAFGMGQRPDITYYDGTRIPVHDGSVDHVLCSEVLEHVPNADAFMADLARVLRPGGTLVLTIPWSARQHHLPHDYRRLTPAGLAVLLQGHGFAVQRLQARGNDMAVIANKLIVVLARCVRPPSARSALWTWPAALLLSPFVALAVVAAHLSMALGAGSELDPLGFAVVATRIADV